MVPEAEVIAGGDCVRGGPASLAVGKFGVWTVKFAGNYHFSQRNDLEAPAFFYQEQRADVSAC